MIYDGQSLAERLPLTPKTTQHRWKKVVASCRASVARTPTYGKTTLADLAEGVPRSVKGIRHGQNII
jgi:hypothetical protein